MRSGNPRLIAELIAITGNESVKAADAIVCLEGDELNRLYKAADLFEQGLAPYVILSGGFMNPPFSIPAVEMMKTLLNLKVPGDRIILESKSQNTREQAIEVIQILQQKGFNRILLVASHFHQARAYLTFLKAMEEFGVLIEIINTPAGNLRWLEPTAQGTRLELLDSELAKLEEYSKKGHLFPLGKLAAYQKWKEEQLSRP